MSEADKMWTTFSEEQQKAVLSWVEQSYAQGRHDGEHNGFGAGVALIAGGYCLYKGSKKLYRWAKGKFFDTPKE